MYQHKSQSGFSLVETLVAVTILLIVIVGPMTIATNTARSTSFSSEQVVAFFLAQEGLETAQKARDDLLLEGFLSGGDPEVQWDEFADESGPFADCYHSAGCAIQIDSSDDGGQVLVIDRCTGNRCRLRLDPTQNRSKYNLTGSGDYTIYTRTVNFEVAGPDSDEVYVRSEVSWRTGTQQARQAVFVETYLYNVYGD